MATKKAAPPAKKAAPVQAKKQTTLSARAPKVEEGPLYEVVKTDTLIDGLQKVGAQVTYYGQPGSTLKPLNAEAKSRKDQVRAIREDKELDADEKAEALKELSDEWNGVEAVDAWAEGEDDDALSDGERGELEQHALNSIQATKDAEQDNTNKVMIQLQGHNEPDPTEFQGATPVLDGKK